MFKLIALPTPQTHDLLSELMAASPLPLDLDSLFIEIGSSTSQIKANPDRVYSAFTLGADVWYETATSSSFLILPLQPSPELAERHQEVGDVFSRKYFVPYLVPCRDPLLRRNRRAWINSIASTLSLHPRELTFHAELVVQDDATVPAQADFYADFVRRMHWA